MLHGAIRADGVKKNARVRVRPFKASDRAGRRGRMFQIVVRGGVVAEENSGNTEYKESEERCTSPQSLPAWHNHSLAHILPLKQAIQEMVRDGDVVALEGFTHL